MTISQRIVALLTFVTIGGMLLYVAIQDSISTGILIKKGGPWDFISKLDARKLLDDIRIYIGLLSTGLGIFIFLGRRGKN
jgi:hypothetical protein